MLRLFITIIIRYVLIYVLIQLNILEPVGKEISIVDDIKYALLSSSMPIVNIWWLHTSDPNMIIVDIASIIDWYPNKITLICSDKILLIRPNPGTIKIYTSGCPKNQNKWLKSTISSIEENDKNGIIIIVADHGGFVGLEYTMETETKQDNEDLINTVFTTAFAVKWPDGNAPIYDGNLKTNVNLFRILFTYLSDDTSYLINLQKDKSYLKIQNGAPFGVYETIDENGNIVFNRHSNWKGSLLQFN